MRKINRLIKSLNDFIAKADDEEESIVNIIPDFPGLDGLPRIIEDYETAIARLLRAQRKQFLDEFKGFIPKSDKETLEAFLVFLKNDLFARDEFAGQFGEETAKFLELTTEELSKLMMDSIDKDIQFEIMSKRSIDWIQGWSKDLADLMQLGTHEALEKELLLAIEEGKSIAEFELRVKDMPQFDRNRARTTARTEILTASSRAHYESFMQSPAVKGKKWKHSGNKKIKPRETHIAMDGVTIPVDDYFYVDGEAGLYPRDTNFSPKNRVNCGCVIGPDVDEDILGLSKEEKERIRQEALAEMGGTDPNFLRSKKHDKSYSDEGDLEVAYKDLELIPDSQKRLLKDAGVTLETGYEISAYDEKNQIIRIGKEPWNGEIVHEVGHFLESELNLYEDADYLKVLQSGIPVDKITFANLVQSENFDQPVNILNHPDATKFVTEYQSRIYDMDVFGDGFIDYSTFEFNPKTLREYFAEGYRHFIESPSELELKDNELYLFIKNLGDKINGS